MSANGNALVHYPCPSCKGSAIVEHTETRPRLRIRWRRHRCQDCRTRFTTREALANPQESKPHSSVNPERQSSSFGSQ